MSGSESQASVNIGSSSLEAGTRPEVLRGRYRVVRLLGQGGMGAVYLAKDALFGDQLCAVKELLGDQSASTAEAAEAQERFAREARLLATLNHPNLPKVRDSFTEAGRSYLVMDYIDGETMEQRVTREGPQSQEQVLGWAGQLCAALEYLHAQVPPVIFRDVAPDNIMVDRAGQVKLIDFGIARVFNPSKQTDTLRFGKVGYAPPEQFSGRGQTTPRSDLFALGATLHFLLTGRDPAELPFVFPPARELNPSVSAEVEQALLSATQMDPTKRPTDARTFAGGLGLSLPPLALPEPSPALLAEVAPASVAPARQEPGLVVFRARDLNARQRAQMRKMMRVGVPAGALALVFFLGLMVFLAAGSSDLIPLSGFFPIILIGPFFGIFFGVILKRQRQLQQGRIALGREGILLFNIRPYMRRRVISWESIEGFQETVQMSGPRLELRLRQPQQIGQRMLRLQQYLMPLSMQLQERSRRNGAQWQLYQATMPIITPWLVSLAPWVYEQLAVGQSPVPAMNLQEALVWFWQVPQRRVALSALPSEGQEAEVGMLRDVVESLAPVKRWIGVPAWASVALLVVSTQAAALFSTWAYPDRPEYPGWGSYTFSSVGRMALCYLGLALVLAGANQRGWLLRAGIAALAAFGALQVYASFGSAFDFHFDYLSDTPYAPYSEDPIGLSMWAVYSSMFLCTAIVGVFERREAARSYTKGDVIWLGALVVFFALAPALQDVVLAAHPSSPVYGGDAYLSLALLPYLPLVILLLSYFQGRSLVSQRLTTLSVLVCGLLLTVGMPLILLAANDWALVNGVFGLDFFLQGYIAVNALVGVLCLGSAWVRLHRLASEGGVLATMGRDARVALASLTVGFHKSQPSLPPGKAD